VDQPVSGRSECCRDRGVDHLQRDRRSADSSTRLTGNAGSITISRVGATTLSYFATDRAGNQASPQRLAVFVVGVISCTGPASNVSSLPTGGSLVRLCSTIHIKIPL
jgi:hypothetical protein